VNAKDTSREPVVDFVRQLLLEAEFDRIAALTPVQLREEFGDGDVPPGWGQDLLRKAIARVDAGDVSERAGDLAEPVPPRAKLEAPRSNVVSLDERRLARTRVYSMVSAAAMVLLVIGTLERKPIGQQIDAWLSPKPTAPVPTLPPLLPPTHEDTPQEKADRLREEAFMDVQKGHLDEARDKLLDAKELDPAGDRDPRVQQAYRTIDAGSAKPMENMSKPSIDPYERPLKKR